MTKPFLTDQFTSTVGGEVVSASSNLLFSDGFTGSQEPDVWETALISGGRVAYIPSSSSVQLEVPATVGSQVVRQTYICLPHYIGLSHALSCAFRLDRRTDGIRFRAGLFDGLDGFYLESVGEEMCLCVTSTTSGSQVVTRVPRSLWNIDRLDNRGPSTETLDITKTQTVRFNFNWYGAGSITVEFLIEGDFKPVHSFTFGNRITDSWARTPNLPLRYEVVNTGNTTTSGVCFQKGESLIVEGSTRTDGLEPRTASTTLSGLALTTPQQFYPLVSIRLLSGELDGLARAASLQVAALDTAGVGQNRLAVPLAYRLIKDPVGLTGSWQNVNTSGSFCQQNTNASGVVTGGLLLAAGFTAGTNPTLVSLEPAFDFQLGRNNFGTTSQVITLAAAVTDPTITTARGQGVLNWVEFR